MRDWHGYCTQEAVEKVLSLRVVRRFEETGRLGDFEDVGNSIACEDMAGEACTTLPALGELDSRSSRECSCSWEYWNMEADHYLSGSVLLLGLDFHGLCHGRGRQHRVRSRHTGQRDRLVVGM